MVIPFFIPIKEEEQCQENFDLQEDPIDRLPWKINKKWMIIYKILIILAFGFFISLLFGELLFPNIKNLMTYYIILFVITSFTFILAIIAYSKVYYK